MAEPPYRDFTFPLNVFMHILTSEEGEVAYLHYGFFEDPGEPIAAAQERSTAMLLTRLPPPPARLLDVGAGVGTTLARLTGAGYNVVGITPDPKQVTLIRSRHALAVDVRLVRFEDFDDQVRFDTVIFQESSQYIDSEALFTRAAALTRHVVVLDEFALRPMQQEGALHSLADFIDAAERHGFTKTEEVDVTRRAMATMDYFAGRIERYRDRLVADLGLTAQQLDELVASGATYRESYANGTYGYRVLQFRK